MYKRQGYAATNNLARLEILAGNYTVAIEMMIPIIEQVKDNNIKTTLYKNIRIAASQFAQNNYDKFQKYLQKLKRLNSSNQFISNLSKEINSNKNDKHSSLSLSSSSYSNTIDMNKHRVMGDEPRRIHPSKCQVA